MSTYQPEGSKMIQQAQAGVDVHLYNRGCRLSSQILEVGGPAAEGVYLAFAQAPDTPERRAFEETYKKMWNVDSIGSYAYYAYDAGMMALAAIQKAGIADPDKLQKTIRENTWPGVSGEVKFDEKGIVRSPISSGSSRTISLSPSGSAIR